MGHLKQLRDQFDAYGIDGLLITKAENRRYLTGFTGTAGVVLITKSEAAFLTDFRYARQAQDQVEGYEVNIHRQSQSLLDNVVEHIQNMNITRLGFEAEDVHYNLYSALAEKAKVKLVPTNKAVERLRMIKTKEEIRLLKKAAEIGDAAFEFIQEFIRPGVRELDIGHELEYFMRKNGATSNSSKLIVASGYRGSFPHGVASEKVIEQEEMVTLDYGALYQGYRSDMTRTIALGEPHPELKKIYEIVYEALQNSLEVIKPGMFSNEVDAVVRDYISGKGYGKYFGHGAGHGIGLEIHEDPFFSKTTNVEMKPGMVVTIEPGIYIPDLGGVRIEDDVVITEDGCDILTLSTKELVTV